MVSLSNHPPAGKPGGRYFADGDTPPPRTTERGPVLLAGLLDAVLTRTAYRALARVEARLTLLRRRLAAGRRADVYAVMHTLGHIGDALAEAEGVR